MTPKGRSRQYVQQICRRIGEDNIELGNACRRVVLTGSTKSKEAPVDAVVQAAEAVVEGGTRPETGDKVNTATAPAVVTEEMGRWQVVDSTGQTRAFDEVRREEIKGGRWGNCTKYTAIPLCTLSLLSGVRVVVAIFWFYVSARC